MVMSGSSTLSECTISISQICIAKETLQIDLSLWTVFCIRKSCCISMVGPTSLLFTRKMLCDTSDSGDLRLLSTKNLLRTDYISSVRYSEYGVAKKLEFFPLFVRWEGLLGV